MFIAGLFTGMFVGVLVGIRLGARISYKMLDLIAFFCLIVFSAILAWLLSTGYLSHGYFGSCQQRTPIEIPRCER